MPIKHPMLKSTNTYKHPCPAAVQNQATPCTVRAVRIHIDRNFEVFLTVHLIITLANNQLDAQILYFIIRLLQSSTCFEQRRAHHQEVKLY